MTIHDIAYFKMQLYTDGVTRALQSWTRQSLEVASRVIALSQNTRADLEALGIAPRKIRVIYGGGNVITEELIEYSRWRELRQRYSLPDKYVLFVGTIHPRKNVPFLLRSFAKWQRSNGRTHGLVLAGRRDSATSEVETVIRDLGIQDSVVITGYLEEWEIPLLYKMADVFVLPTLYEGFTLVTIEAMNYGVPVIATDTSSIREGVGEAAVLVPLNDVDALSDAIGTVVKDSEKRRRMVDAGKEQAKKFTWETCARQTIEVYKEVHQNGR